MFIVDGSSVTVSNTGSLCTDINLTLTDALYVLQFSINLLSISSYYMLNKLNYHITPSIILTKDIDNQ